MYFKLLFLSTLLIVQGIVVIQCSNLLYPRESETREVKSLNGIWRFLADETGGVGRGFKENWHRNPLSDEVGQHLLLDKE